MEKNCPCCNKHCPVDNLSCPTGKKHFGIADAPGSSSNDHPRNRHRRGRHFRPGSSSNDHPLNSEDKLLVLLRQCGHFLHHNVGNTADTADLFNALSPQERQTLETLLAKCLQSWQ